MTCLSLRDGDNSCTPWGTSSTEGILRYAIVGGTGTIGSWLAHVLRARGDEVWIVTRRLPRSEHEVQWDPTRGIHERGRLEGLDAIFNLAGAHIADRPWTRRRRQILVESRVNATEVLLESLARLDAPPRAYVGVGHIGLFGDRGDAVIDDDDPPASGFLAELAVAWEGAHLQAESIGCRASVLRLCMVLAPHGGAFPLLVRPFRYVGGWLGDGRQYISWMSIRDATAALIHLADTEGLSGGFNGSVPEPIRNRDWCRALGRVMHVPVVTHAPKWAIRGALGELADGIFLASLRVVPRKLLQSGFTFVDPDPEPTFRWLLAEMEHPPRV